MVNRLLGVFEGGARERVRRLNSIDDSEKLSTFPSEQTFTPRGEQGGIDERLGQFGRTKAGLHAVFNLVKDAKFREILQQYKVHVAIVMAAVLAVVAMLVFFSKRIDPALSEPLFKACEEGNVETVKQLLRNGADANSRNEDDQTPLHIVMSGTKFGVAKQFELAKLLLDYGADPNAKRHRK